ncbi:GNAT family N-acetyltransferase [Zoogloea sp.]|uniref:GNAT family N-acetyltransferase n=1 Tax=Zoogloea sp. TaxID=49181 RepID=UPI001415B758|nr:MAG: GNAT family N-acetyltransferase [Zoogloea sp.]
MPANIREFNPADALNVNALALRAFEQFQSAYNDWPAFRARVAGMSSLADAGELLVAEIDGQLAGAVAYIGPGKPKPDFFRPEWAIMRMLVVSPDFRGQGIGRALAEKCLQRAKRDKARFFALHTSTIMQVALPMYLRMGFQKALEAPSIYGVEYGVYLKKTA